LFTHVTNGRDKGGDGAFHVGGAATIHLVVDDFAAKRVDTPGRVSERNSIDMAGEAQRRLAVAAADPRDEIGAVRSKGMQRSLQSGTAKDFLQMLNAAQLIPGRIDRVKGNEFVSSAALAGMEVAKRYHIPYVNTNGWSDAIREKGYAEVFNPGNYNNRVGDAVAASMKSLGAKRVVAFAENTDYGIGLAKVIGAKLKEQAPQIDYKFETLDRASKDFLPAILPLRANPPDVVIDIMLPPASYIMMNQVYEQGIAPSATTWFYDASGLADYPDFWQNVKEAGKGLLVFGLYHPKMSQPPLGKQVGDAYTAKTKSAPNRLLFQAADSLLVIADAAKRAKSTEPDALIKALEETKLLGTRGELTFSKEAGYKNHQWIDVPYVTFQLTEVNQKVGDSVLVEEPGKPLDPSKLWKPTK